MGADPIVSQKKRPSDDVPRRMMTLLLEMLKSGELADDDELLVMIGGAWAGGGQCLQGRPSLGPTALECGIFELAVAHLHAIGSSADWVSLSRNKAGRAGKLMLSLVNVIKSFAGQANRPDLVACVTSGLFDLSVEAVAAFAVAGANGLGDTDHYAVFSALIFLRNSRAQPGCEAKIRSVAPALAYCLENNLDIAKELGATTQGSAAQVCCSVFGRDDGGSEFTFTQQQIDILLTFWAQIVRAVGYNKTAKPTADSIMALELCISDENKPLLLSNPSFVPYMVDALMIDPSHPRAEMEEQLKSWCQEHHAECFAQLAVFAPAREALRQDPSVIPALQAVAEIGLSAEARKYADAALLALSNQELHALADGEQKHIMLSYQWDVQAIVQRINDSLLNRGYVTWLDLTHMRGSVMDASELCACNINLPCTVFY